MATLMYIANTSLDGFVEGPDGSISWGEPDEEFFGAINEIQRPVGTYLYGRRMYEAMLYWDTAPVAEMPPWMVDFTTMWREADKVVFSTSLASPSSARTTLERDFDVEAVRELKEGASRDLTVGGADLAAQAFGAGLVDEYHVFIWPVVLGGGKPSLPRKVHLELQLLDERRHRNGIAHLHYRVTG